MSRSMVALLSALVLAGCATAPGAPTSGAIPVPTPSGVTTAATPLVPTPSPSLTVHPSSTRTARTSTTPTPSVTRAPTATPSSCDLPAGLLGNDLKRIPGSAKVVALTFDAGASDDGVAPILATLNARGARATFFLTGRFAVNFPSSARAIARVHPIGNHTQNHADLTALSDSRIRAELRTGESSIRGVTGVNPRPYFRFPSGAVTAHAIAVVNTECYIPFGWTVDSLGWKGIEGGMSAAKVRARVLAALRPGAIVLMHVGANPDDGSTFDADALPGLIDQIRSRGYELVTLERVLPATP